MPSRCMRLPASILAKWPQRCSGRRPLWIDATSVVPRRCTWLRTEGMWRWFRSCWMQGPKRTGNESNRRTYIKLWNAVVNYKQRCVFLQKHWGRVLFNKSALSTTALPTQCANTALVRQASIDSPSNAVCQHSPPKTQPQLFQHSPSNAVFFNRVLPTQSFQHSPSTTVF